MADSTFKLIYGSVFRLTSACKRLLFYLESTVYLAPELFISTPFFALELLLILIEMTCAAVQAC